MGIANGLGRTSFQRLQDKGVEGAPASVRGIVGRPVLNPLLAQISNLLVGGTETNGIYSFTVTDLQSGEVVTTVEFDRQAGETNNQIADELRDAANADPALNNVLDAAGTSPNVQLDFQHAGLQYSISTVAPGGASLTPSVIQAAGGTVQDFGRFVSSGPNGVNKTPVIVPLDAADVDQDIHGVIMRPLGQFTNQGSELGADVDAVPVGRMATLATEDEIYMVNRGTVTANPGGQVHVVRNTAGGQELGQARADADGANSTPLSFSRAYWAEETPVGQVGAIMLKM